MRPFPAGVIAHVPPWPGRLTERPWWSVRDTGLEFVLTRTDGAVVIPPRKELPLASERAAAYDSARPLPRPAVVVGQTWAVCLGAGRRRTDVMVFTITEYDSDHDWPVEDALRRGRRVRPVSTDVGPGYYAGAGWIREHELVDDLLRDGAYLLADPVCPWQAPWSPP